MAIIMDGKALSMKIKENLKKEIQNKNITVGLAVIVVGNNPASRIYVDNKKKDCEYIGYKSEEYALPESTTQEELLLLIDKLNKDESTHGILVQLPLPSHIDEKCIINSINPNKDVDAFHPENVGRIVTGNYSFLPCTPAGVMELLEEYNIEINGKNCVVMGRSNIVGKPMSLLLIHKNGTVTICHSKTKDIKSITSKADILVCAIGKAKYVTEDMVKEGAVVIDVGMDRDENNKLCGDVDFENVVKKAYAITPVPGGVGPMTRAVLMKNTLTAYKNSQKK